MTDRDTDPFPSETVSAGCECPGPVALRSSLRVNDFRDRRGTMDRSGSVRTRQSVRPCRPILLLLAVALVGCVPRTDLMDYRPSAGMDLQPPHGDESLVVFLRPGRMAGLASSSVFDDTNLVAVLMDYTYAAYETTPGIHRFMVLGEAADFMDANLDAGKVYFARVTPRFGIWRARFSLAPVTPNDKEWQDLHGWMSESYLITPNAAARSWAQENAQSILEKRDGYLVKWLAKDAGERPMLYQQDGVRFQDIP